MKVKSRVTPLHFNVADYVKVNFQLSFLLSFIHFTIVTEILHIYMHVNLGNFFANLINNSNLALFQQPALTWIFHVVPRVFC